MQSDAWNDLVSRESQTLILTLPEEITRLIDSGETLLIRVSEGHMTLHLEQKHLEQKVGD